MFLSTEAWEIWRALDEKCRCSLGEYEVRETATQLSLYSGCMFGCISAPRSKKQNGIVVTFGLPARVESERIWQATEPYPQRWTHHVLVSSSDEIDDELIGWLDAAQAFAKTKKKR